MEPGEKVTRMEDILKENSAVTETNATTETIASGETNASADEPSKKLAKNQKSFEQLIPKGKPKSGRIWKEQKTRFSSIVKTRGVRLSFDKKQKLREDLKRVKEMSRAIKEKKKADKEAKKQRRIENLKRAEENRKKSEIVQVITNTAKLKRTKKKQLRMIEKRDTLNLQKK